MLYMNLKPTGVQDQQEAKTQLKSPEPKLGLHNSWVEKPQVHTSSYESDPH